MKIVFYTLTIIGVIVSILPLSRHPYWVIRVCDFLKLHAWFLHLMVSVFSIFIDDHTFLFKMAIFTNVFFFIYHSLGLIQYTPLYKAYKPDKPRITEKISIICSNVFQDNKDFDLFIDLVLEKLPDMVLTMESNKEWEDALVKIEEEYPNYHKVALENTYGMHFYTRLEIVRAETNYYIADDVPSFEIELKSKQGKHFTFIGIHPPPPSPTEEETSEERDGELLSIAKKVKEIDDTVIVAGDFNQVAWGYTSKLFRKTSRLVDPRIGRGLKSTFHTGYRIFRVPIDQVYHTSDIEVETLGILRDVGSDHFPLYFSFYITANKHNEDIDLDELNAEETQEVEEIIEKGKQAEGNRD